ncbi:MAG: hypothetical protein MUO54_08420 [Anaerolineales bacterium]|nr:hypothetical protein [Anaerolineales bacterium]
MNSETPPSLPVEKPQKSPGKSIGGILLRLLITIIAAVLLGAIIYYSVVGWRPFLDNRVFQPIDNHSVKLKELEETQSGIEDQVTSLQATLDYSRAGQDQDTISYQFTLEAIELDLQHLKDDTGDLLAAVSANTHMSTQNSILMATLVAQQSANMRHIEALATAQMKSSGFNQELELLKILELLSRANQFLLHSNYGEVEEILQTTKIELIELQERLPGFQQEHISNILDLVEQAIVDLPAKPSLAKEKLELAWQLGITGLPRLSYSENIGTVTPTPYLTPDFTPTPTHP